MREASVEYTSIERGARLLGDNWTLLIINVLANARRRFSDVQRELGSISPTTLAERLKRLERYGLIRQEKGIIDRLSVTYQLTDMGKATLDVLKSIDSFSQKYL